jgi:hypothetical protein
LGNCAGHGRKGGGGKRGGFEGMAAGHHIRCGFKFLVVSLARTDAPRQIYSGNFLVSTTASSLAMELGDSKIGWMPARFRYKAQDSPG